MSAQDKILWLANWYDTDHWCIAYFEKNKNKIVYKERVTNQSKGFLGSLPGYFCCTVFKDDKNHVSGVSARSRALVISRSDWNKISAFCKGTYNDCDGRHPELKGRKVVVSNCVGGQGSDWLVEGVHFIIR